MVPGFYRKAVLEGFGLREDVDLDHLTNRGDAQAGKAMKALKLAEDARHEGQISSLLNRCAAFMDYNKRAFLSWLKADIARCAAKYGAINAPLASKERMRAIIPALESLPNPNRFTASQVFASMVRKRIQFGVWGKSKAGAEKPKRPSRRIRLQSCLRGLTELAANRVVTRLNPQQGVQKAGRGGSRPRRQGIPGAGTDRQIERGAEFGQGRWLDTGGGDQSDSRRGVAVPSQG